MFLLIGLLFSIFLVRFGSCCSAQIVYRAICPTNDGFVRLNLSLEAIDEKLERLNVQQTSLLSETERIKRAR